MGKCIRRAINITQSDKFLTISHRQLIHQAEPPENQTILSIQVTVTDYTMGKIRYKESIIGKIYS